MANLQEAFGFKYVGRQKGLDEFLRPLGGGGDATPPPDTAASRRATTSFDHGDGDGIVTSGINVNNAAGSGINRPPDATEAGAGAAAGAVGMDRRAGADVVHGGGRAGGGRAGGNDTVLAAAAAAAADGNASTNPATTTSTLPPHRNKTINGNRSAVPAPTENVASADTAIGVDPGAMAPTVRRARASDDDTRGDVGVAVSGVSSSTNAGDAEGGGGGGRDGQSTSSQLALAVAAEGDEDGGGDLEVVGDGQKPTPPTDSAAISVLASVVSTTTTADGSDDASDSTTGAREDDVHVSEGARGDDKTIETHPTTTSNTITNTTCLLYTSPSPRDRG